MSARVASVLTTGLLLACSSEKDVGVEGGPCYPNNTCNAGFVCASGLCVRLPDGYVRVPEPDRGADLRRDSPRPDLPARDSAGPDRPPVKPGAFVTVVKGVFSMGSPQSEPCREGVDTSGKETQHQVYLTRDFEIMATEVTQGEFSTRMGYNPAFFSFCGDDCPVERATWHDAVAYCNVLSQQKGLTPCYTCTGTRQTLACETATAYEGSNIYTCPGYRLPTEAEWEFAYRAGTTSAFYNGTIISCEGSDANADLIGWYNMNAQVRTHPVGKKLANGWGLYDMPGNVYEWIHDWYEYDLGTATKKDPVGALSGTMRVLRGGGLGSYARSIRAASRWYHLPANRFPNIGFRCARSK